MLTDAQKVDVRRWMGYATLNATPNANETDYVFSHSGFYGSVSLTIKLGALTSAEEEALTTRYLTPLATLETDILGASANLDTLVAGPWEANPDEVGARSRLFDKWRRDMAAFLGFEPGPALGARRVVLGRC